MMGAPSGVGIGRTHSNAAAAASDRINPTAPGMSVNPSSASTDVDACQVYLSLIQQYLSVFQVDNALWLSERCLADYPRCYEAVYMQALCYYRMGKIKNCHACLNRHQYNMTSSNSSTTTSSSNACGQNTSNSMIFLSALCSMELGDYSSAETILLQGTRIAYKQQQTRDSVGVSMDDWILQSTVRGLPLLPFSLQLMLCILTFMDVICCVYL
jgi:Anaphase-promoting complex, cyclosome, subunit 3